MRYDFKANRWPDDQDDAAARNGDVFHALAKRGVSYPEAKRIADDLEHGQSVEDVEIELVFAHGDLETQMSKLDVEAACRAGEPREPFTVNLRPLRRQPWTVAVTRALINWGQPEEEAAAIARRVEGSETVIVLRWVSAELEELVVDQFEGYGVEVTKLAGS